MATGRFSRIANVLKSTRNTIFISTGSVILFTPTTFAEGKPTKPSIYDPPEPTRVLIRNDPTPLEESIRSARLKIVQSYNTAHSTVTDAVDKWIGIEKQVETTLKEVAPKGEETIIPGAVYVGIAGMGGSILARNRMFPIRFLSPLVAIGIAGYYFLPETTSNILALARKYEERVPVIKDIHDKVAIDYAKIRNGAVKEVEHVTDKLGITTSK